jgi:uncharacterized protein YqjF (DUF2071 family)
MISISVSRSAPAVPATPGTLEHFLVERYILFAQDRHGRMRTGEVHHEPYQIRPIKSVDAVQTLTAAMGCPIPPEQRPDHVAYSDGVDVRVSPLAGIS